LRDEDEDVLVRKLMRREMMWWITKEEWL